MPPRTLRQARIGDAVLKIAVIYNRESQRVINLFGMSNREKYGLASIQRIVNALRKAKHQVKAFEGDKDIIPQLENFMPQVVKGERPGMVFNVSYGIQGQARYTQVPSILEMVGIPYVGSGPLAHSLSLDKVVAKMIFLQHGLPTPEFAVLDNPNFDPPEIEYPLIVKPKNEAVSFGIRIVQNEDELREAAQVIFDEFHQAALVEQYIEGREINVGIIGNNPAEVLQPAEVLFGEGGPRIYTVEDKKRKSGREIGFECPANLSEEQSKKAQEIALKAFKVLGCFDCARIDMRLDAEGNFYILEINSLPSLGQHGSYVMAAAQAGLDFPGLINRLVEEASSRYFGTPAPPSATGKRPGKDSQVFSYLTRNRDRLEERLARWTQISSATNDPVGIRNVVREVQSVMSNVKMNLAEEFSDDRTVWTWETKAGLTGGTVLLVHGDVPVSSGRMHQSFRREPEWLYGEGIGSSSGPLAMVEFALRSLGSARALSGNRLGILLYNDEGSAAHYSASLIQKVCARAARVLVLHPSGSDCLITQRRGQRTYRFTVEGKPDRIDHRTKKHDVLAWASEWIQAFEKYSSKDKRLAIAPVNLRTTSYPMLLPHRATADILMAYLRITHADEAEGKMRAQMPKRSLAWELNLVSDRPPLQRRRASRDLAKEILDVAAEWDIEITEDSSVWPSVAGLVPNTVPVVCGLGPVVRNLYTGQEAVNRLSLMQRTLLLAQYLSRKS